MNRAINIVEVNTPALEKEFLEINATLNKTNPHYIRPLDNEVLQVFDRNKNKLFKTGDAKRWITRNDQGIVTGRIAAFYYESYKNK